MVEYHAAVLCAFIIALPVSRRWVMEREKEPDQLLISGLARVKENVQDLNVACGALANLLVGRRGLFIWIRIHKTN